jgi:hypothetical protein
MDDLWEEDSFRWWLEDQPEGQSVGSVQNCYACSIANYLHDKTGDRWSVNERRALNLEQIRETSLPKWGHDFIYALSSDEVAYSSYPSITREEAMGALRISHTLF